MPDVSKRRFKKSHFGRKLLRQGVSTIERLQCHNLPSFLPEISVLTFFISFYDLEKITFNATHCLTSTKNGCFTLSVQRENDFGKHKSIESGCVTKLETKRMRRKKYFCHNKKITTVLHNNMVMF